MCMFCSVNPDNDRPDANAWTAAYWHIMGERTFESRPQIGLCPDGPHVVPGGLTMDDRNELLMRIGYEMAANFGFSLAIDQHATTDAYTVAYGGNGTTPENFKQHMMVIIYRAGDEPSAILRRMTEIAELENAFASAEPPEQG